MQISWTEDDKKNANMDLISVQKSHTPHLLQTSADFRGDSGRSVVEGSMVSVCYKLWENVRFMGFQSLKVRIHCVISISSASSRLKCWKEIESKTDDHFLFVVCFFPHCLRRAAAGWEVFLFRNWVWLKLYHEHQTSPHQWLELNERRIEIGCQ